MSTPAHSLKGQSSFSFPGGSNSSSSSHAAPFPSPYDGHPPIPSCVSEYTRPQITFLRLPGLINYTQRSKVWKNQWYQCRVKSHQMSHRALGRTLAPLCFLKLFLHSHASFKLFWCIIQVKLKSPFYLLFIYWSLLDCKMLKGRKSILFVAGTHLHSTHTCSWQTALAHSKSKAHSKNAYLHIF